MLKIVRKYTTYYAGNVEIFKRADRVRLMEEEEPSYKCRNIETIEEFVEWLNTESVKAYLASRNPDKENQHTLYIRSESDIETVKIPADGPFKKKMEYKDATNTSMKELIESVPAHKFCRYLREQGVMFDYGFNNIGY